MFEYIIYKKGDSDLLTDIHTHLYEFSMEEIRHIMEACKAAGIGKIITCVYNMESLKMTLPLLKEYDNIYISAGIHPQASGEKDCLDFIPVMERLLPALAAIGEIGYDAHKTNPTMERQREVFLRQLEVSKNTSLPVIIHCRNVFDDLFNDLDACYEKNKPPIILHSYSGGFKYLNMAIKNLYYISFSGSITFERAVNLKRIAPMVPPGQILCETDSPYIPPETSPKTEKNNPANLSLIVKSLAGARNEDEEIIRKILSENISSLFNFGRVDRSNSIKLIEDIISH